MNATQSATTLPNAWPAAGLHAGFWYRAAALLIDLVVLVAALALPTYLLVNWLHLPFNGIWGNVLTYTALWSYFALFESSSLRATPGKLAFGLQVVDERGNRISFVRASVRVLINLIFVVFALPLLNFFYAISGHNQLVAWLGRASLIGWPIMIGKTRRKQGPHDWISGTFVALKTGLQAFHEGDKDAMKRLRPRFPRWVAVLVMAPIFAGIPAWSAYRVIHRFQINNQVLEASTIAQTAKAKVAGYSDDDTSTAPDNAAVGLPEPTAIRSRYVTSLEVRNGTIIVTLGAQAAKELQGKHLLFTFTRGEYEMAYWRCTSADIARALQPIACM